MVCGDIVHYRDVMVGPRTASCMDALDRTCGILIFWGGNHFCSLYVRGNTENIVSRHFWSQATWSSFQSPRPLFWTRARWRVGCRQSHCVRLRRPCSACPGRGPSAAGWRAPWSCCPRWPWSTASRTAPWTWPPCSEVSCCAPWPSRCTWPRWRPPGPTPHTRLAPPQAPGALLKRQSTFIFSVSSEGSTQGMRVSNVFFWNFFF